MTPDNTASTAEKTTRPRPVKRAGNAVRKTRSAGTSKRRPGSEASTLRGYSDQASRLIARGKNALGDVYKWAGDAGDALPKAVRNMNIPDHRSLQTLIDEKPLVLGAVGLGLGVVLGTMLPAAGSVRHMVYNGNSKRKPARRTRRK